MASGVLATIIQDSANASSYTSPSFTPQAGDLIIVAVVYTSMPTAGGSCSGSGGMTFHRIGAAKRNGDVMEFFIANSAAVGSSQTITATPAVAATGCAGVVGLIRGTSIYGSAAVVQSAADDEGASLAPSTSFPAPIDPSNMAIAFLGCQVNGFSFNPPADGANNYTKFSDASHGSPNNAVQLSWFTGAAIDEATWATNPGTTSGTLIVELDISAASGDVSVSASAQTVTLATVAPTVTGKASVPVTPLSLTLSQLAPSVAAAARFQTTPLLLTLSQLAASVGLGASITAATQVLTLSTATVIVSTGGDLAVSASVQTLVLNQLAATVSGGARFDVEPPTVAVPERRLVLSIPARTVTGGASFQTNPLDLVLSLVSPAVTGKASIVAATQLLTMAMVHPTVTSGSGTPVTVVAATQVLTLSLPLVVTTVQERNMYGIRTVVAGPTLLR